MIAKYLNDKDDVVLLIKFGLNNLCLAGVQLLGVCLYMAAMRLVAYIVPSSHLG
jgi:hypothetical protein